MPIQPKYSWTQSVNDVSIQINLIGASRSKTEIFATDVFVKVNQPPFLLTIDLLYEVHSSLTVASVNSSGVTFSLKKKIPQNWDDLLAKGNKQQLLARRNASIDRAYEDIKLAKQARKERKLFEDRQATDRSIQADENKRRTLENRKKQELDAQRQDLMKWQQDLGGNESDIEEEEEEEEVGYEENDQQNKNLSTVDHPEYYGKGWQNNSSEINNGPQQEKLSQETNNQEKLPTKEQIKPPNVQEKNERGIWDISLEQQDDSYLQQENISFTPGPPPRQSFESVPVTFTQLETNYLPAREKREEELRLYKKNMQSCKDRGDDIDIGERQPAFLKDKGDGLFQQGNYEGAVNAYSKAIMLDDSMLSCYANRAACFLKLNLPTGCLNDCTYALENLQHRKDKFERGEFDGDLVKFKKLLVHLYARRGQAYVQLNQPENALSDFQQALKYDPQNLLLQQNLEETKSTMKPMDLSNIKEKALQRFKQNDFNGAADAFSTIINSKNLADSNLLANSFSNRAACYVGLEKYKLAISDCYQALKFMLHKNSYKLYEQIEKVTHGEEIFLQGIEFEQNLQNSLGVVKVLGRLGVAYGHVRDYDAAKKSLQIALFVAQKYGYIDLENVVSQDLERIIKIIDNKKSPQYVGINTIQDTNLDDVD